MTDILDDENPKQPTPAEIEEKRFLKFLAEREINSREELYRQSPARKCEIGATIRTFDRTGRRRQRAVASQQRGHSAVRAWRGSEKLSPEEKLRRVNEIEAKRLGYK